MTGREQQQAGQAVLLMGAALFGSLILLPLYFQVDRGESTFSTGLLLAPQGLGAALVMPISGRLTDRIGDGRVALCGLIVVVLGTFGLTRLSAHTSYGATSSILFVRGIWARVRDDAGDGGRLCDRLPSGRPARHHHDHRGDHHDLVIEFVRATR